ncbi:hypothetical protein XI06_41960 [Bradyrhizobium sp. CCBAU 11434]|nr:hypothetical protein [Bradyrhizobium sp. CCBAU 11434]
MEDLMRIAILVVVMVVGLSSAARADRDYPWCVMGGELGYSGDCMYETREQCLASASGRWNLYCDINPRVRFKQQQQQVQPPRRTQRSQ